MADYVVYVGLSRWCPCLRFSCPWFGQYIDTEWTVGLGEPVNVILSAKSDPQILIDQEVDGGLRNYFLYVPSPSVFLGLRFPLPLFCFVVADRWALCVSDRFNSEQSVWASTRVRTK